MEGSNSVTPKNPAEIQVSLISLNASTGELRKALDELEKAIEPVLRGSSPKEEKDMLAPPPPSTLIGEKLHAEISMIRGAINHVRDLIERVEL